MFNQKLYLLKTKQTLFTINRPVWCVNVRFQLMDFIFIFRSDTDDDLSKLKNEAVPDDVRKWLESTFASKNQVTFLSDNSFA